MNPNTDPLLDKFRESFSEYQADFSPDELQNSWSSVQSNIQGIQPVHPGALSKILTTKGIAITSAVAVIITSAIILTTIILPDNKQPTPVAPAVVEKNQINKDNTSSPQREITLDNTETNTESQLLNNKPDDVVAVLPPKSDEVINVVTNQGKVENTLPKQDLMKKAVSEQDYPNQKGHIRFYDTILCAGDSFRFVFIPSDKNESLILYLLGETKYVNNGYNAIAMTQSGSFTVIFEIYGDNTPQLIRKQVVVYALPYIDFSVDRSASPTISFIATSTYSCQYNWDFGDQSKSFEKVPLHTYFSEGNYRVSLLATSEEGCSDSMVKSIVVNTVGNIRIPNSFSPNNDGVNDEFYITIQNENYFSLVIFDRYNNKVFEADDKNIKWDGTAKSVGNDCQAGTYYFVLRYKLNGDEKTTTKYGKIRLFR